LGTRPMSASGSLPEAG